MTHEEDYIEQGFPQGMESKHANFIFSPSAKKKDLMPLKWKTLRNQHRSTFISQYSGAVFDLGNGIISDS